jgi:hypothetical protein
VGFTQGVLLLRGKHFSLKEINMFQDNLVTDYSLKDRTKIVMALSELRMEWQDAVHGGSLLKVEAPVGLLLADIADRLQLSEQERYAFLGGRLINEVNAVNETRVRTSKTI